tara:strand:+ start:310 stop:519 length:210 start_codon:yes stop_codon:yes gene_type:complete
VFFSLSSLHFYGVNVISTYGVRRRQSSVVAVSGYMLTPTIPPFPRAVALAIFDVPGDVLSLGGGFRSLV